MGLDKSAEDNLSIRGCVDELAETFDKESDSVSTEFLLKKRPLPAEVLRNKVQGGSNVLHGDFVFSTQRTQDVCFGEIRKRQQGGVLVRKRYQRLESLLLSVFLRVRSTTHPGTQRSNWKLKVMCRHQDAVSWHLLRIGGPTQVFSIEAKFWHGSSSHKEWTKIGNSCGKRVSRPQSRGHSIDESV